MHYKSSTAIQRNVVRLHLTHHLSTVSPSELRCLSKTKKIRWIKKQCAIFKLSSSTLQFELFFLTIRWSGPDVALTLKDCKILSSLEVGADPENGIKIKAPFDGGRQGRRSLFFKHLCEPFIGTVGYKNYKNVFDRRLRYCAMNASKLRL